MRLKRGFEHFVASLRALALLMLVPTLCNAGGFALNEYAARANAMGGAMIALADDASAVAYNPAGITQLPGTRIMVGATAIAPTADVRHRGGAETTLQTNIYTPPHAYLVYQAGERAWLGLGIFTRFGLGTQYGVNWAGAGNTYRAELESYSLSPNLALKITDSLSVAFGPEIIFSSADLRRQLTATTDMRMNVSGIGAGFQAALHYKFNEEWSLGFTYHTTQHHTDSGQVKYTENAVFHNQALTIALNLPASYNLGIAYKPNKDWKIEADAIFTQWSDYSRMTYDFEYQADSVSNKEWRNVWRFQLGAEYMATDWLALRAGFVWDQDPIRKGYEDYMLPTSDRKIYSTGFGIIDGPCTYDFSVMYLMNNHRSVNNVSTSVGAAEFQNSRAYMAGFSFGYKF